MTETDELHVVPLNDLVEHDTEGDCVCVPDARPVNREDGSAGWLMVHHSLDGREASEDR